MTTLQQSLINARKVMNKVDGGDFSKGNVQLSQSNISDSSGLISEVQAPPLPNINTGGGKQDLSPKSHITEEHIKNSRLPDAIKKAMIESPIPDIPFNGGGAGLSEEFLSGVKTQMDKQGIPTSNPNVANPIPIPSLQEYSTPTTKKPKTQKLSATSLKSIIKESVKELLDESIGFKKDSDENFQFRVGDRIFYGKITSSKSVK